MGTAWSRFSFTIVLAASVVAVADTNCSLLLDASASQCTKDADCSAFQGYFCGPQKTCIQDTAYCASNADCVNQNGQQPYVCHKEVHKCFSVLSPDCTQIYSEPGDISSDDTVWLGSMMDQSANPTQAGQELSVHDAREDLKAVRFLPGVNGGPRRPFAIVSCDLPTKNPETFDALTIADATHLINDVRVVGILGPTQCNFITDVLTVSIPATVPVTSFGCTADTLDNTPGRTNYFYRMFPTNMPMDKVGALIVKQRLEPFLTTVSAKVPTPVPFGQLKVALYVDSTAFGVTAKQVYPDALNFNGMSGTANGTNYSCSCADTSADGGVKACPCFQEFDLGDPNAADWQQTSAAGAAKVLNYAPDVIIVDGEVITIGAAADLVEQAWGTSAYPATISKRKPEWVAGQTIIGKEDLQKAGDPSYVERWHILTYGPTINDPAYQGYDLEYQGLNGGNASAHDSTLSAAAYDGVYMFFYGVASLGNQPLTPQALGPAMFALANQSGVPITWGQNGLNTALGALSQGKPIQFSGATGTPIFNSVGDNTNDSIVFVCLAPPPQYWIPSGLQNSKDGTTLTGTSTCFD